MEESGKSKYDHLQGKYIMRFPFTLTSIKWGLALGSFISLHTFLKTRSVSNSVFWFFGGTVLSGMPIWGFFMFKYSFYSYTLRKFEQEQNTQVEQTDYLKTYLQGKLNISEKDSDNDDLLVERFQKRQQSVY